MYIVPPIFCVNKNLRETPNINGKELFYPRILLHHHFLSALDIDSFGRMLHTATHEVINHS